MKRKYLIKGIICILIVFGLFTLIQSLNIIPYLMNPFKSSSNLDDSTSRSISTIVSFLYFGIESLIGIGIYIFFKRQSDRDKLGEDVEFTTTFTNKDRKIAATIISVLMVLGIMSIILITTGVLVNNDENYSGSVTGSYEEVDNQYPGKIEVAKSYYEEIVSTYNTLKLNQENVTLNEGDYRFEKGKLSGFSYSIDLFNDHSQISLSYEYNLETLDCRRSTIMMTEFIYDSEMVELFSQIAGLNEEKVKTSVQNYVDESNPSKVNQQVYDIDGKTLQINGGGQKITYMYYSNYPIS